ncbi:hypothetical protein HanIR_Chr14g0676811 [Helianthus annuus]|nr:hypothetical protein HanIR_Chr14g0676811 [Helianthus annuus]
MEISNLNSSSRVRSRQVRGETRTSSTSSTPRFLQIPPGLEFSIELEHVVTGRVNTVNRLVGESISPIRPKHAPQIRKTFRPLWLVNVPFWNHPKF